MEDILSEAIANRTHYLTAYSTLQLRYNKSSEEYHNKSPHRYRKDTAADKSPGSTTDHRRWDIKTQLRCRTNSCRFTKFCYCCCSCISWPFSLPTANLQTTYHHPYSHQHIHPKHFPLSYLQRNWLVVVFLLSLLLSETCVVMAYPAGSRPGTSSGRSENKHWTNPCNINWDKFNSGEVSNTQEIDLGVQAEHFYIISKNAEHAMDKANKTKREFATETFSDQGFMTKFNWMVYDWLPKIPSTPDRRLNYAELLRKCYEHMQRYAVAIEQMILDQILYDGNYVDKFREMEQAARSVLCPLQQAILAMKITSNKDVTKEIMSEAYRSIDSDSVRDIRDYIILREFISGLSYIHKEFEHKYIIAKNEVEKKTDDMYT